MRRRGITARLGCDHGERLGRHRWVVERTLDRLLSCQRLALRDDRTAPTVDALARRVVVLVCTRRVPTD